MEMPSSMYGEIPPEREEIDALVAQARQLEDQGDLAGALRLYRMAITRLPEGDTQREHLETVAKFLEEGLALQGSPEMEAQSEFGARPARAPVWVWGIMAVCLFLVLIPVALGLAIYRGTGTIPIPRLANLAPTPLSFAPAPSFLLTPTEVASATLAPATIAVPVTPAAAATTSVPATSSAVATTIFEDKFNQAGLDSSRWIADNTTNATVRANGGLLHLASTTTHFPYLHARSNPFPPNGDFRVTMRFRFPQVSTCGAPIAMASYLIPTGVTHEQADQQSRAAEESGGVSIWFWHETMYYRQGAFREDISMPGTPGDWRDVVVGYVGGVYQITVNGTPIYTSPPTAARPQSLWMGLPFDLGGPGCAWDTLEVSELRIEALH